MLVVVQAVVLLLLHVVDLGRELDQSDTNVCAVVEFHARNEDSIVGLLLHRLSNLILDSIDNVIVFTFASVAVVLSDDLSSGLGAGLQWRFALRGCFRFRLVESSNVPNISVAEIEGVKFGTVFQSRHVNEDSIVGLLFHRLSNLILDSIDNVIVFTFAFDRDVVQSSIDVVLSDLLSSGLGAGLHSSLVVVSRRSLKSDTSFTDEKMDLSQDSIAKGTDEPKLYL